MDVLWQRQEGKRLGLELTKEYLEAGYKELERIINGIGPAWMDKKLRDKVTDYFEYFLPSACQHDFDFDQLEKTEANFEIANKRFYKNMKIQIKRDKTLTYWSFNKRKSKWRKKLQARFLYKACVYGGESAFFEEE
jgi:hypothetical protein